MYREMTIGTAVPSKEQLAEVPHHFVQTISVRDAYSAGRYEADALALATSLFEEGHETLVMCGGSGFYIDAFCNGSADVPESSPELRTRLRRRLEEEGLQSLQDELRTLDPEGHGSMDTANPVKVLRGLEVCLQTGKPFSSFQKDTKMHRDFSIEKLCLTRSTEELYDRIDRRVEAMADAGLEEEARVLLPLRSCPAMHTVGYQEFFALFAIQGESPEGDEEAKKMDDAIRAASSLPINAPRPAAIPAPVWPLPHSTEDALSLIKRNTRHYAKKQLSWWRRDPSVRWLRLG